MEERFAETVYATLDLDETLRTDLLDLGDAPPMAIILLVDSDLAHMTKLASALRECGHRVITPTTTDVAAMAFHRVAADLAIVELSHVNDDRWRELRRICQLQTEDGLPIPVVCCSRVYHGPRFELDIERLGARFVYER